MSLANAFFIGTKSGKVSQSKRHMGRLLRVFEAEELTRTAEQGAKPQGTVEGKKANALKALLCWLGFCFKEHEEEGGVSV